MLFRTAEFTEKLFEGGGKSVGLNWRFAFARRIHVDKAFVAFDRNPSTDASVVEAHRRIGPSLGGRRVVELLKTIRAMGACLYVVGYKSM